MITLVRHPMLAALMVLLAVSITVGLTTGSLYWFLITGPYALLAYLTVETGDRVVSAHHRFRRAEGLARTGYRQSLVFGLAFWTAMVVAVVGAGIWINQALGSDPLTAQGLILQSGVIVAIMLIFPCGRFLRLRKLDARRT